MHLQGCFFIAIIKTAEYMGDEFMIKVIFVGDIYGNPGRKVFETIMPRLKNELSPDFCIANVENAASGRGVTLLVLTDLFKAGVDFATTGNHVWSNNSIFNFVEDETRMVIPANLFYGVPGHRFGIVEKNGKKLGVINLLGNVYMTPSNCPFRTADEMLEEVRKITKCSIIDFHAEATSEKVALGWYVDGRASAVIGTHTHVQTADERILPCGTAFISDAGMTGPIDGVIGTDKDIVIKRFLYNYPIRMECARGRAQFNGVYLELDEETGTCTKIARLSELFEKV